MSLHSSVPCERKLSFKTGSVLTRGSIFIPPERDFFALMTRSASFHYAWIVAALTFLVLIVVAGVRSASGVLFVPLGNDMGWSAATISAAVAINVTLYGAMGPFAAALMQRIGLRWAILLALAVIAVSTAASSLITTPLGLALTWGLGLGLGVGTVSMVLATVVATRWFVSRRGMVLGALTGGTATGQLVFLPLLAFVATKFGWRPVGLVVAACAVAVAIPIFLFMRDPARRSRLAAVRRDRRHAGSAGPRGQSATQRVCRTGPRVTLARLLACRGDVLRLRREYERFYRHPLHRRLRRSRNPGGSRRGISRVHGTLQFHRDDGRGLALR